MFFHNKHHKFKITINNIKVPYEEYNLEDITISDEGDFFNLRIESTFAFKIGYLKAFSFPDNFKPKDFTNAYHLDADLAEVFKTALISDELTEVLQIDKLVYISQVFIEKRHRRKGLGSELINELHKLVQTIYPNQKIAIVLTASPLGKEASQDSDIHTNNAKLNGFYRNLGYSDVRGSIVKYIKL